MLAAIMRTLLSLFALLALVSLSACAKKDGVDTSKLESSFSSAEPSVKAEADKIVTALKAQDWAGATASLKTLASNVKLTDEQKKAVSDTLAQIGNYIKDAAGKVAGEAGKALDNVQQSLPK